MRLLATLPLLLLAACSSAPEPAPTRPTPPEPVTQAPAAHLSQLSGQLQGVPAGAEVELALLEVDERGRPLRSFASQRLNGNGGPLPFALGFDPQALPSGASLQLHARATQAGRLILRLPPQRLSHAGSQDFGALQLVRAP